MARKRLSGEDRRAQIIDVALTLFAEKGFASTRTHEIAQAAGISEALIFQHFKTKDELIREALAVLFHPHPVSGELVSFQEQTDDEALFFRTIALHVIKHNREDPRIFKLAMYSSLESGNFGELTRNDTAGPALLDLVTDYVRRKVGSGEFVRLNPDIVARLFVETVFMFMADQSAAITGPVLPYPDEDVVDTLVAVFLRGLKKN